jgi:integrase/recombinase XerD
MPVTDQPQAAVDPAPVPIQATAEAGNAPETIMPEVVAEASPSAEEIDPSDNESEVVRLLRRGRVGAAHIRLHKGVYWEVDLHYPGGLRNGRHRWYRKSPTAAYRLAIQKTKEARQHGSLANALSTAERWMAYECFRICERIGAVLLDVVREFERTHPHGANARSLDQVRTEVIASKQKLERSERHIASLDYRLRCLITALGDKPITAITTEELQQELARHRDWNATTIHSVTQGWKIAFNFAIRRGYLLYNPANRLELPKIVHEEPVIFTVEEARKLMAATLFAERHPLLPACRAYLAIGLFAGLRPEEIERLEWRHVSLDTLTIRVKAANAKDRDRRIVEIQPNLAAWLAPLIRARGNVLDNSLAKLRAAARTVFGLAEWPHDIMRHTYVSYHFGEFNNEAYTKKQVGHRDDGRIFYNHYMVPVSRVDARLFWGIVPPAACLPEFSGQTRPYIAPFVVQRLHHAHAPRRVRRTAGTGRPAQEQRPANPA